MTKYNEHIDFEQEFFKSTRIDYPKSKEEVWAELEFKLNEKPKGKIIRTDFKKIIRYSAAAVLILGLGLLSFLRLYSVSVYCPNGQHTKIELPDGSMLTLNANSQISYNPYWWNISRKLHFSGEGFFEVKKGEKFMVVSETATTSVLGTKFNIYSRNKEYKVNCISGKVLVKTTENESTILTQNEFTMLSKQNKFVKLKDEQQTQNAIAWMNNEFVFTSMELKAIYEEIERQYDVTIEGKENLIGISTFNAKRGSSAEEMIHLIGKPFGVTCTKLSERAFRVEQNQ